MKFSNKLLVLSILLLFIFGISSTGVAFDNLDVDKSLETSDYIGNVPYEEGVNAEIIQLGNNDEAEIIQEGFNYAHVGQGIDESLGGVLGFSQYNEADIIQDGYLNEGEVNQRGENNKSLVWQIEGSQFNYAGIGQHGDNMFADLFQVGDHNFARSSQFGGEGSWAYVIQFGDYNYNRTIQKGYNHDVEVHQGDYFGDETSDYNYSFVDQSGESQDAYVWQLGAENATNIEQDGSFNYAKTYQDGELNEALIDQNADGMSALITQIGDNNTGSITQTGGGM